jgi:uncharacterized protein YneF (UPF0154 family)
MFRTIYQLATSVLTLIVLLSIPYFIGTRIASDNFTRTAEISESSAQSAAVLGISDHNAGESDIVTLDMMQNLLIYTMVFLAVVAAGSFIKYKVVKKNGIRK